MHNFTSTYKTHLSKYSKVSFLIEILTENMQMIYVIVLFCILVVLLGVNATSTSVGPRVRALPKIQSLPSHQKSAVLDTLKVDLKLVDTQLSDVLPQGYLLVKLECASLCHTDLHIIDGG